MFGSVQAGEAAVTLTKNAGQDFSNTLKDMFNAAGATEEAFEQMQTPGEKPHGE